MKISRRLEVLALLFCLFVFITNGSLLMAAAVPSVSPSSLNFGTQPTGAMGVSAPLTISNMGDADLVISSITLTGPNPADFSFAISPSQYRPVRTARGGSVGGITLPLTLSKGRSASVTIGFIPKAAGSRSATLTISTNAGGPQVIPLAGAGALAGFSLSASSLNLGSQLVGATSTPSSVTVTNNGAANLVITDITVSGANPADFVPSVTPPPSGRRPHRGLYLVVPPSGSTNVNVAFKPTAAGSRSGTLNIFDNAGGSPHTVALSGSGVTPAGHLTLANQTLGANLEKLVTVSVDNAPASELTVTITSSDSNKLLISSDTSGTTQGTASITAPIHAQSNAIFPGFYIQSLANSGTAQITVTAPNYVPATATITFSSSGFVLNGPAGSNDFSTTVGAPDASMSVTATNLDSGGHPVSTIPSPRIRGGLTVNVPVNSSDTSKGTISGSPAVITGGSSTSSSVTFHPVAAGTTVIGLGTPDVAGFTTPASGAQLTATISQQEISINPAIVGYNLQVVGAARLGAAAPANGLQVTITSADPSKVLLSPDVTGQTVGSASIILSVAAGQTVVPGFIIQALASSGTVGLAATAPGYQNGTSNVLLTPSAFVIDGGKGVGQNFSLTPISSDPTITVSVMRLDAQNNPVSLGVIRAGQNFDLMVNSSDTNVGSIFGDAPLKGGDTTNNTGIIFHAWGPLGSSVLSVVQPAGFGNPTSGAQLTATVTSPAIALNVTTSKVGQNLQISGFGSLNAPAQSDLTVTITSNNANVLVSNDPTLQGSSSTTVVVPAGKGLNGIGFPTFYIQSLAASGAATITASSSDGSFTSATLNVTLSSSAFVLSSPNGIGQDFAALHDPGTGANPTTLTVLAYQTNASTHAPEAMQAVRGGLLIPVNVFSSATNIGTISGSPVTFSGGMSSAQVNFVPGTTTGQTTLTASPSQSGLFGPSSAASLKANVN